MNTYFKIALLCTVAALTYMTDVSIRPQHMEIELELINEADAVLGVRRRTARRSVAVGYTMGAAEAAAATQQQPAPAATPAPPPAAAPVSTAPPVGSIVSTLPAGCVSSPKGGVQYFNCAGVYYRSAFQGNNLVYVVSQP